MISAPVASVDCDSAQRARAGCAVQGKTGPSAKVDLQPVMNIAQPNAALLLLQTVSILHGSADFLKPVRRYAFAVILSATGRLAIRILQLPARFSAG